MKYLTIGVVLLLAVGCTDPATMLKEQQDTAAKSPGVTPNGGGPADANGSGVPPAPSPAVGSQPQNSAQPKPAQKPAKSIIGQKTREILDAKQATKSGGYVVVSSKVQGSDPLTQAGSVYTKAASFAGSLPLKQWLKQEQTLNGRHPTYRQLTDWMNRNRRVDLPVLTAGRRYGYNEDTGKIVVLEKPAK